MSTTLKQLEKISKALGDENRLKILQLIAKHGGVSPCAAVQDCVELAQPSVSHHIKILIEAGLIEVEKEGRHRKYWLNRENFNDYLNAIGKQILMEQA